MKKHYLFLTKTDGIDGIGGAEHSLMDLFSYINYNSYSVRWVVRKDDFSPYFESKRLPVKVIQLPSIRDGDNIIKKFLRFYKFFQEIQPDCIVFSQFWLTSFSLPELIAGFLITKGNIYMIVHDCAPPYKEYKSKLHFGIIPGVGLEWRKERFFQKLLICFTKYTIAVSQAAKNSLIKFHKYPERKIKIAYHGVDTQKFVYSLENKAKFRRFLNIPGSATIIVSTARLDKIKRLGRLIKAFSILSRERDDIWLIFAGDGPQYNALVNMVNYLDKDTKERVKFLGYVEDVVPILQTSDIYVLPSDSEGFALACLEALSCGLISIATNSGGPSEVIKDGFNGFLVENNLEGVLKGLKRALFLSNEEKERLSNNARKFIIENFKLRERAEYKLNLLGITHEK